MGEFSLGGISFFVLFSGNTGPSTPHEEHRSADPATIVWHLQMSTHAARSAQRARLLVRRTGPYEKQPDVSAAQHQISKFHA